MTQLTKALDMPGGSHLGHIVILLFSECRSVLISRVCTVLHPASQDSYDLDNYKFILQIRKPKT